MVVIACTDTAVNDDNILAVIEIQLKRCAVLQVCLIHQLILTTICKDDGIKFKQSGLPSGSELLCITTLVGRTWSYFHILTVLTDVCNSVLFSAKNDSYYVFYCIKLQFVVSSGHRQR